MRVNGRQLTTWSFLMSSAHGAGLMLTPVIVGAGAATAASGAVAQGVHALESGGVATGVVAGALAVGVHTVAMLAVMGLVAVVVYEKVGLGILRSAWVNVDMLWAAALVASGLFALFT